jgi:hypothetical protein
MCILRKIFLFFILALIVFACRKQTVANWDVDVALPIVQSRLNIKNFVGDTIFKADNNGLLSLSVNREITSIKLDSLIKLPDTSFVKSFTVPIIFPVKAYPGQVFAFFPSSELKFTIDNNVSIKKVEVRSGKLSIKFSNKISQPIDMQYVIPSAVKNGRPFTIFETVPPGVNSLTKEYDLTGYNFNMQGLSGNVYNTLVQSYTISINPLADTAVVSKTDVAEIDISYSKLVPQYIEGYFGEQTIKVPLDTAKLELLNNFKATNFKLTDARLNFSILNEFGAEFNAMLSGIKSINVEAVTALPLTTSQLSNLNINRATKVGTTVFPSIQTISLTSSNSNIVPFLSNLPDKLTYQGQVKVNPLLNISGYNDFAFYGQGIHVIADINIPFRFNADRFMFKSNTVVNFGDVEQLDLVKGGNFVILAKNGFPFKVSLQAYLMDAQNQVIDSLFVLGQNTIEAGLLDQNNLVTAPNSSRVLIPINSQKIKNLRRSSMVQIVTYFIMPPNPPDISIYEQYNVDVNIVAELTYNVERK